MPKFFWRHFRQVLMPCLFHRREAVHLADAGE
jgi:hypothetical protein